MSRKHDNRSRKTSAGKPPLEILEMHGEILPDAEGLDLRAGRHKQELGRSPRTAPVSLNETMNRYKKSQAQKFSEHIAKPDEPQNNEARAETPAPSWIAQGSVFDESVGLGETKRKRIKNLRKPKVAAAEIPQGEAAANFIETPEGQSPDGRLKISSPAFDEMQNETPESTSTPKDHALQHERPSPLKQESGRLNHKRTPVPLVASKSRKPDYGKNQTSQNATFENSPQPSPLVHENTSAKNAVAPANIEVPAKILEAVTDEEPRMADPSEGNNENLPPTDNSHDDINMEGSPANFDKNDTETLKTKREGDKLKFEDETPKSDADFAISHKSPERIKTGKKLENAERKVQRSSKNCKKHSKNSPPSACFAPTRNLTRKKEK